MYNLGKIYMTNSRARAITTRYKGYAFRSRLEARWAVFFDHLGITWEYEPEGFELGNGLRYLPDFWLPEWKIWVEVKPDAPDDVTREKAWRLVRATGHALFATHGMPDRAGTLFCTQEAQGGEVSLLDLPAALDFARCAQNIKAGPLFWVFCDALPLGRLSCDEKVHAWCSPFSRERAAEPTPHCPPRALHAARAARFEFGEKGGAA